jgi:pimeloyl-ACP methyl ester carboxylesterase
MIVFIIILAAVLLLALALAVFILVRYIPIIATLFMNVTVRRGREHAERFEGEDVSFETVDGVRLVGTLGPAPDDNPGAPIVVFCHEFTATRHSAVRYAWFLREAGFRVFTFDFRAHGDSGCPQGYAPRQWATQGEIFDLRSALRWLRGREENRSPDSIGNAVKGPGPVFSPVALFGISRGAVVALSVAETEASAVAVVSDGAFSTIDTLDAYITRWAPIFVPRPALRITPKAVFHFYRWLAFKLSQHRLSVRFVDVTRALKRLRLPVLFIHGGKDSYLGTDQAQMLCDLVDADKEMWVVPDADHNEAVEVAPDEYSRRIVQFLRRALGEAAALPGAGHRQEEKIGPGPLTPSGVPDLFSHPQ